MINLDGIVNTAQFRARIVRAYGRGVYDFLKQNEKEVVAAYREAFNMVEGRATKEYKEFLASVREENAARRGRPPHRMSTKSASGNRPKRFL